MHTPERWGFVQFSGVEVGRGSEPFVDDPNEGVKWALRRLYYRQRTFRQKTGSYASALSPAQRGQRIKVDGLSFLPELKSTQSLYEIVAPGFGGATVPSIRMAGCG